MDFGVLCLTALGSFAALFVFAKLIGHKQIAQLDFFDYITGITIGSIAAEMATELEEPWKPLVAMAVYGLVTVGMSLITSKWPRTRPYVNGTPLILLHNGQLYRDNLKKAKLDLNEFLVLCRQQGYFDLSSIQTAVFEYNGQLSILPRSTQRPVTPEDLHLSPQQEGLCTELIMDGRILDKNLIRIGKTPSWLQKQLQKQQIASIKDVFLAVCDAKGKLTVYPIQPPRP